MVSDRVLSLWALQQNQVALVFEQLARQAGQVVLVQQSEEILRYGSLIGSSHHLQIGEAGEGCRRQRGQLVVIENPANL